MIGGVKNKGPKLSDVMYGQPLNNELHYDPQVSHLVQVRTPQGLKLYRLASPGAPGAAAAVATQAAAAASIQNSGGRFIMQTNRPQQQPQQQPPSHLQSVIGKSYL